MVGLVVVICLFVFALGLGLVVDLEKVALVLMFVSLVLLLLSFGSKMIDKITGLYRRRQIIKKQLDDLVDETFLDRAWEGERSDGSNIN